MPQHWNCFVAGCTSIYTTKISGLKYYRIPKKTRQGVWRILKTDGVKWDSAFICSRHWSKGRENSKHLPDVRTPDNTNGAELRRKSPYDCSAQRSKAIRLLNKQLNTLKHEKEMSLLTKYVFEIRYPSYRRRLKTLKIRMIPWKKWMKTFNEKRMSWKVRWEI